MKRKVPYVILLALPAVLCTARSAQAQEEPKPLPPISSERGGFTNGTETVEPRHLQAEIGFAYLRADHTHTESIDDNSILRYGLRNTLEVRFGVPAYRMTRNSGHNDLGWDDAALGVKWRFLEEQNSRPSLALIASTTLPIGSRDTGQHFFQPQISLEAGKNLGTKYSVEADVVYTDGHDGDTRYDQWSGGFFIARHVTSLLDVFAETYRVGAQGDGSPNTGFAGGGITYLLNRDTVFDFGIDNGIFRTNRENLYLSTGVSHRW